MLRTNQPDLNVQVSLDLDGRDLTITRGWNPTARPRESIIAEAEGDQLQPEAVSNSLARMAGLPGPVLNRLWFVPEMRLVEEANLFDDISNHLRHLLGIDSLEAVADRTKKISITTAKRAGQLKQADRLNQSQRSAAEQQSDALETELNAIDAMLELLRINRGTLATELVPAVAWEQYGSERSRFLQSQKELADQAEELGVEPDIRAAVEELQDSSSTLGRSITTIDAEQEMIRSVQDQLAGADASCPVCLQPLSPDQANRASEAHNHRIDALAVQKEELEARLRDVTERSRQITSLARAMSELRHPVPPAVQTGRPRATIQTDADALDVQIEQTNRRRGEAAVELRHVQDTLATDMKSAHAETQITAMYATETVAKVLSEATRSTAADRVERALIPLTDAISEQWQTFFPGRGTPALSGQGRMVLRQGESQINYSQFSGGEKVLASLITRLLFVASSTGLRSIWLDEPLEHLDPVNRVKAARLLVEATRPGRRIKQIVVTTYEEGLARALASRHEHVRLRYVSTSELL